MQCTSLTRRSTRAPDATWYRPQSPSSANGYGPTTPRRTRIPNANPGTSTRMVQVSSVIASLHDQIAMQPIGELAHEHLDALIRVARRRIEQLIEPLSLHLLAIAVVR